MHTHSLGEYMRRIAAGDWRAVGELMLSSANKLTAAGADFLICPDNTIHQALPYVATHSPRPWLHIAEVVADAAAARGIEVVRPTAAERDAIHRIIMDELVRGVFTAEAIADLQRAMNRMKGEGCDAVVLGCTEIPLIMNDANSPLPTLDSTRLLARAALRASVG